MSNVNYVELIYADVSHLELGITQVFCVGSFTCIRKLSLTENEWALQEDIHTNLLYILLSLFLIVLA